MKTETYQKAFRQIIEEAFNQQKFNVLHELFDHEYSEHQFGLHPTIEGMKEDIQYLHKAFPDFNLTIDDMVVDGDQLWSRMTASGTNKGGFMGPPNGNSFQVTVFDVVRFVDDKIVDHWGVPDRFAIMAQLNLLPKPQPAAA